MDHGDWLRRQREIRGWARREMARRLVQAGQAAGDTTVPDVDCMSGYVRRWERDRVRLTERYRLYCCTALGVTPDQFGTAPPDTAPPVPAPAGLRLPASVTAAYCGEYASDSGGLTVEREVLMTAHESGDHAEQAGQPGLGDTTLEQLRADVTRLAGLSDTGQPLAVFLELRRVRDRIYRLLDRKLWPREQTDLYFLLGCLHGIMAIAANRLGYPDAAEELNRAGFAYANAIDHRPLMAHLRGELSVYTYYLGRFEASRDLALSGLEYLSAGPHAACLHIYHARASDRLGDPDAANQAVRDAHQARDRDPGYNDDLLEIGGNFAVSTATHHALAGSALTATTSTQSEAAEELERAIAFYDQGPGEREEHWFGGKPLAGIDLAVVRLRSGALDAAEAALEPVFSLPTTQRITDMTIRLAEVRGELAAPIFGGSARARALGERIEEFDRESVVAGLHSLPGGPG
jgi:transcriptional regulator with XRE-family HTH domain/tetratricopeptide (TPR) repeat protein